MMKATFLISLCLLSSLCSTSHADEVFDKESGSSSPLITYEYKILGVSKWASREDLEDELNRLGKLGWKIEAVERWVGNGMKDSFEFYLSRKIEGNREQ